MTTGKIKYSKKICGLLASLTAFICALLIFLNAPIITMGTLIYSLKIIVPAVLIVGYLGFKIGNIFDTKKKKKSLSRLKK